MDTNITGTKDTDNMRFTTDHNEEIMIHANWGEVDIEYVAAFTWSYTADDTGREVIKRATAPRKPGFDWESAEIINGRIIPRRHVDYVMATAFGISLEYLIHYVHELDKSNHSETRIVELALRRFVNNKKDADSATELTFGLSFEDLIMAILEEVKSTYDSYGTNGSMSDERMFEEYCLSGLMENYAFPMMDDVYEDFSDHQMVISA